jgi:hypothetical protein
MAEALRGALGAGVLSFAHSGPTSIRYALVFTIRFETFAFVLEKEFKPKPGEMFWDWAPKFCHSNVIQKGNISFIIYVNIFKLYSFYDSDVRKLYGLNEKLSMLHTAQHTVAPCTSASPNGRDVFRDFTFPEGEHTFHYVCKHI